LVLDLPSVQAHPSTLDRDSLLAVDWIPELAQFI